MSEIYRDKETETLLSLLQRGRNILMLAPRRAGKTFMLNKKFLENQSTGFQTIMFEVSGMNEEKDFFRSLCETIQEEQSIGGIIFSAFSSRLKNLFLTDDFDNWKSLLKVNDYRTFADQLLHDLNESQCPQRWLIIVDELPLFIMALIRNKGREAANTFLYWLRKMQQKYKNLRWIYAGSVGLGSVARQHGLGGALVDLEIYSLPPFKEEIAREFLREIADKRCCKFIDNAEDKIISRLGWLSPCYLELIGEEACTIAKESVNAPNIINIITAEDSVNNMLEQNKRTYWSTWKEHLDKNFNQPHRSYLNRLLEVVGKADNPVSKDSLIGTLASEAGMSEREVSKTLRYTLDILLNDGYLTENPDGRYQFMFPLLRDWWRKYVIT